MALRNIFNANSSALADLNQLSLIANTTKDEFDEETNNNILNKYGSYNKFYDQIRQEKSEYQKRIEAVNAYNLAEGTNLSTEKIPQGQSEMELYNQSQGWQGQLQEAFNQSGQGFKVLPAHSTNTEDYIIKDGKYTLKDTTDDTEKEINDKEKKLDDLSLMEMITGIVKFPFKTVKGMALGIGDTLTDKDKLRELMNDPLFQIGTRMVQESGTPSMTSPFGRLAKSITDTGTYLDALDAAQAKLDAKSDKSKEYKPDTTEKSVAEALADQDVAVFMDQHPMIKELIKLYDENGLNPQLKITEQYVTDTAGETSKRIIDVDVMDKDKKIARKVVDYEVKEGDIDLIKAGYNQGDRGKITTLVDTLAASEAEAIAAYDWNSFVLDKPTKDTKVEVNVDLNKNIDTYLGLQELMQNSGEYITTKTWLTDREEKNITNRSVNNTIAFQVNRVLDTKGPVDFGKSKKLLLAPALLAESLLPENMANNVATSLGFENLRAIDTLQAINDLGNSLTVQTVKELYPVSNKDIDFVEAQYANIGQTNESFVNISAYHTSLGNYNQLLLDEVENFKNESLFAFPKGTIKDAEALGMLGIERDLISDAGNAVIYTDRDGVPHEFFNARDYAEFAVADKLLKEFNESEDLQATLENIPILANEERNSNIAAGSELSHSPMTILFAKSLNTPRYKKLQDKLKTQIAEGGLWLKKIVTDEKYEWPADINDLMNDEKHSVQALAYANLAAEFRTIQKMEDGGDKNRLFGIFRTKMGWPDLQITDDFFEIYPYLIGLKK